MTGEPFVAVERIAQALLYEGFLLFPYRATALKNRVRTSFGELAPEASRGFRRSSQTAEIPVVVAPEAAITARVAFLRPVHRVVRDGAGLEVERVVVGEREIAGWEEAHEVVSIHGPFPASSLGGRGVEVTIPVPAVSASEELRVGDGGPVVARVARRAPPLVAALQLALREGPCGPILRAQLRNASIGIQGGDDGSEVLHAAHVALHLQGGTFVSVVDPPAARAADAESCDPDGAWFVLAGPPGDQTLALASPIILDEHPAIAPESPRDLFDATENDELLTLCLRALGEEERRAIVATDPRAAALVDAVIALSEEAMGGLHGAVRGFRAPDATGMRVRVGHAWAGVGDAVVLAPAGREPMDAALRGRRARIVDVVVQVDGREHLVVVLDDDPGRDLGLAELGVGHRFFVTAAEVEVAAGPAGAAAGSAT